MTRILKIALFSAAFVVGATSVEAALNGNGTSLTGASTSSPVAIVAVELP
jgi:hypothetical protein